MLASVLHSKMAVHMNISIMRAFVAMRNYILLQASDSVELAQLRERVLKLEQAANDILEDVNDLSEFTRKDIDAIYEAIGALSVKLPKVIGAARKIGFRRDEE